MARDMSHAEFVAACARRGMRLAYGIVWLGPRKDSGRMVAIRRGTRRRLLAALIAEHERLCAAENGEP